ncbi:MAG: hypothetical protein JO353_01820 [Phycisphaerae bacterium]|nr:hypothetical protein [Phycisphaerae bacterium]
MNASPPNLRPHRPRLLIVGDSLALGAAEVQGMAVTRTLAPAYPDLLRNCLPDIEISIEADVQRNSTTVCTRIVEWLAHHQPSIVLAAIGGSDADCDWRRFILSDGSVYRSRTKLDTYVSNLRRIAEHVRRAGASLILTEPSNQDVVMRGSHLSQLSGRDVTAMINAGGGQPACDQRLLEYRKGVWQVANETGAHCVACAVDWEPGQSAAVLCEDGAHLNHRGHRLLADSFERAIRCEIAALPAPIFRCLA